MKHDRLSAATISGGGTPYQPLGSASRLAEEILTMRKAKLDVYTLPR